MSFGTSFVTHSGEVSDQDLNLASKEFVLVYFSAHWCPPCRMLTPVLAKIYEEWQAQRESIEVLFVSSDREEEGFREYHSKMPFPALPYRSEAGQTLQTKITSLPTLMVFRGDGSLVTANGRQTLEEFQGAAIAEWRKLVA